MTTRTALLRLLPLLLSAVLVSELHAGGPSGRRDLKFDFEQISWIDSACATAGVELLPEDLTVTWAGISFKGLECGLLVDAYCEETISGDFNEQSFGDDELGLAALVGANTNGAIFGARWSVLSVDRFDAQTIGYGGHQWAFYFFPGDITIVALYGLINQTGGNIRLTSGSFIRDATNTYWQGSTDGFAGEYFCFRSGQYTGTWDGNFVGSDPSIACPDPNP